MKRSAYLVTLSTNELFTADEYQQEAGHLLNLVQGIVQDTKKLSKLTRSAQLTACHTEAEIAQDETGLTAHCVIEMEGPEKVALDKTKLTAMVRAAAKWPRLTVTKRSCDT